MSYNEVVIIGVIKELHQKATVKIKNEKNISLDIVGGLFVIHNVFAIKMAIIII